MDAAAVLAQDFRYDCWANSLWLECLNRKGGAETERGILAHVLSAQKIWLLRCNGESPNAMPVVDLTQEAIAELSAGWVKTIERLPLETVIKYRRSTGEAFELPIVDIALQVITHGCYHRGELRGLCRANSDEDFPETDRARFSLTSALST